jgi:hypothetical protein
MGKSYKINPLLWLLNPTIDSPIIIPLVSETAVSFPLVFGIQQFVICTQFRPPSSDIFSMASRDSLTNKASKSTQ